jgi:hypothetical protein
LLALFEGRLPGDAEWYFGCNSLCTQILGVGLNSKLGLLHQLDALLPQELDFKLQFISLLIELRLQFNQLLIFLP